MEPVFGQIKQGRGLRQFLLRGLDRVKAEWLLICTGHNLLKLFGSGFNRPGRARGKGRPKSIGSPAWVTKTPILATLLELDRLHQGKSVVTSDLRRHRLRLLTTTQTIC